MIVSLDSEKRDDMKARKAARPRPPDPRPLTARKREVLGHLLKGASERTVALAMRLSINTVHSHVKVIYLHFKVHIRPRGVGPRRRIQNWSITTSSIKVGTLQLGKQPKRFSEEVRAGFRPLRN
ncbi:MAG TPA: LuxR C-terminal-related transcriptional regulator [Tepidisphaeraceae bacterium]|jgi:DNA-binding CsgD family transcriptional regulator|nr:LuxR C-terminal-related transcriptional regulator [Tepidisphaeraceae bacterium]